VIFAVAVAVAVADMAGTQNASEIITALQYLNTLSKANENLSIVISIAKL